MEIVSSVAIGIPDNSARPTEGTAALSVVEKRIREAVAEGSGAVRDMCEHIAGAGGKRIRPQLVLHSGLVFSRLNDRMVNAAVAVELIHMASLVHDDVIDRSELRRGRPTVNKLWGNHAAVLCGDWLYARAFGALCGAGMAGCMGFVVEAIRGMCEGEIMQAGNLRNFDTSPEDYLRQITGKTAGLLQCCCKCGAQAGGANAAGIKALGEFGLNAGLAFQIVDDILDLTGDSGKMGKPKGEDLRQGVVTLPVILLLRRRQYGGPAREMLMKGALTAADRKTLNGYLAEAESIDECYGIAGAYIGKALKCLEGLPDSEGRAYLTELASGLERRSK